MNGHKSHVTLKLTLFMAGKKIKRLLTSNVGRKAATRSRSIQIENSKGLYRRDILARRKGATPGTPDGAAEYARSTPNGTPVAD